MVEGRQEDAEEFLTCLLNGLSDEMTEQIKLVEPERKDGEGENDGDGHRLLRVDHLNSHGQN